MNRLEPQRVWLLALPLQCIRPPLSFVLAVGGFCVDEYCSTSDQQYQYVLFHFSSHSAVKWAEMEAFLNRMNCAGQRWSCRGSALSGYCAADVCMHPGFRLMRARLEARDPRLLVWRSAHCAVGGLLMSVLPTGTRRRAAPVVSVGCVGVKKEGGDGETGSKVLRIPRISSGPASSFRLSCIGHSLKRLRLAMECFQPCVFNSRKRSLGGAAVGRSHKKRQRMAAGCGGGFWAASRMGSAAHSIRALPSFRPDALPRGVPRIPPLPMRMLSLVDPVWKTPVAQGVSVEKTPVAQGVSVEKTPVARGVSRAASVTLVCAPFKKQIPIQFVERENDSKWTSGWAC